MSHRIVGWAIGVTTGSPTRKAVLMALAERHNGDTDRCDPSMERVAADTELSIRSIERATADLVRQGVLARSRRRRRDGSLGGYSYTFPRASVSEPPASQSGSPPAPVSGQEPEVDLEPESTSVANAPDVPGPKSVNRRPVTMDEHRLSTAVLATWNELADQDLRSDDWLVKIIGRIREYPEATLDDHRFIIEQNLLRPWWEGPPNPSVVYGSGAQFERAVTTARNAQRDDGRIARIVADVQERRQQ